MDPIGLGSIELVDGREVRGFVVRATSGSQRQLIVLFGIALVAGLVIAVDPTLLGRASWEAPVFGVLLIFLISRLIPLFMHRADTPRIGLTAGGVVVRAFGKLRFAPWDAINSVDLTIGTAGMPVLVLSVSPGRGTGFSRDLKVPLSAMSADPEAIEELVHHYWERPEGRLSLGGAGDDFLAAWMSEVG